MNFQGFLNDLQDWELSVKDKDKDKKVKPRVSGKGKLTDEEHSMNRRSADYLRGSDKYKPNYGGKSHLSSNYMTEETFVDANSEKEQGNEYFKQKKFNEAIDCYSRSIALSPTAVAYANRAMAYIKVKRFQEAEADCTEALNLDDRYIKAYSRRATAKKELGNLKEALDDIQFALRLEPNNQEIKKQSAEIKSLLEKAILQKVSGAGSSSSQTLNVVESKDNSNGHAKGIHPVPGGSKKGGVVEIPDNKMAISKGSINIEEIDNKNKMTERTADSGLQTRKVKPIKQDLAASVHELASRAASRAVTEAARNISPPNSAYQFETSWKGFCGDLSLQTQLLKVTPPDALPGIFKNALSISVLTDIMKCLASIFTDEPELSVKYLKNLTKISRFDMLILCLPATEKANLCKTWDEIFLSNATPAEYVEVLSELRPKYCPGQ